MEKVFRKRHFKKIFSFKKYIWLFLLIEEIKFQNAFDIFRDNKEKLEFNSKCKEKWHSITINALQKAPASDLYFQEFGQSAATSSKDFKIFD